MIIGQYNYNLDPKKRLTIPPKFRSVLSKGAILTRGIDGCLFLAGLYDRIEIWNEENWQKYGATTGTQVENIAEGLKELGI
ncbi:MAG: Protein MraZ [Parcubacteria bacterium 34_609]|nr:MAG: Protein MraZ [Parcubacteria bacterium 34_609]